MTTPDTPPSKDSAITLREVTEDTVSAICKLSVSEKQNQFVALNSISFSQALFSKYAWFRAIYADDEPVGFVMLHIDTEKPEYYLWRYMIDTRYQKMGFGRRALNLIINHVKALPNATELVTSIVEADGSPQGFYEGLGFKLTGEMDDGEAVMKLVL